MIFKSERKIYGYECDMYGHMNHASYLHIYEEARCEALETIGIGLTSFKEKAIHVYIRTALLDYYLPVENGESVTIVSEIKEINPAKILWHQYIENSKKEICNTADITSVFAKDGRICRINHNINQLAVKR